MPQRVRPAGAVGVAVESRVITVGSAAPTIPHGEERVFARLEP
jgi:uncharacterized Ntn-hydrolase superfamily protein